MGKISTDEMVAAVLGVCLIMATWMRQIELATTIASGLIGYMGRAAIAKNKERENEAGQY